MKKAITCVIIVLFNIMLFAQTDTIPRKQNVIVEVYDVVAVFREHTDRRGKTNQYTSEIRGKILNYDESTGVLTFKGQDGKMYSFKSPDYKYFEYDREFTTKIKIVTIKPRKDAGFEISAGLSATILSLNQSFTADDFYLNSFDSSGDIPISLKVGASKYLNKNSVVGITGEYALIISDKSYFNVGARYQYLYNTDKNATFYFPVELKFSQYKFNYQYEISDTTYTDDSSWYYPSQLNSEVAINALELNIGQGISIALKNKKSLSLELMLLR